MYDQMSDFEAGKVIVALHRNLPDGRPCDKNVLFEGIDYEKMERIFPGDGGEAEDIWLVHLRSKDKSAVLDAVEKLSGHPCVIYAEPDYLEELHLVPNDPLYGQLWGTQRIGAPLAWRYTTGSTRVAVGVIDSGIDHRHPDIRRNMWASPRGRVLNGWNFGDNNSNSIDTNGHGTHVAGTVGAVGNNRIGITGVCLHVSVVSMKFGLDIASAIEAIHFANFYRIPILNASWGGRGYSQALKYAIDHYNGLFIASAGNFGENNDVDPLYPASYDSANIISVAATNPEDTLARFSNYGLNSVDIGAPGTDILSLDLDGGYSPKNGTSMAAPHVAGAAALLKAYRPYLSTMQLKNIILSSADTVPDLTGRVLTGGILNVNAMFQLANGPVQNRACPD
ncbi:S8 family peptidase [Zongyangia hominis]|uniref:S8 family serine peptidase n=1 Tax=Zongyangia hominis TaxID=2763677 RepID=A0A926E9W7_9FIRM|nr:S8 family peptidase [Zongyangia hominis]MBC8570007.1 S8 family serine peptidase [Zongyangia hominis]